jgi:hypothetical protein
LSRVSVQEIQHQESAHHPQGGPEPFITSDPQLGGSSSTVGQWMPFARVINLWGCFSGINALNVV